jgi:hypothetical protein
MKRVVTINSPVLPGLVAASGKGASMRPRTVI